ncbi:unnamed protein product [Rotaria socialis]|uniref:G domain-containing protein n=1 Tax=Rotaria socialis TaxID=392032 RepID=A0A818I8G7_9BILA|nr:unnamed protein product [Rotaria socialis]
MNQERMDANILLCGAARVGKTSLINAICQQQLVKSSAALDCCTRKLKKYQVEYTEHGHSHRTIFWDLPGVESWNETDVRDQVTKLIMATKPLCMIYCASPGSFAKLGHVKWLVSECAGHNIFCALVCTNMWAGKTRQVILIEFRDILQKIHQDVQPLKVNNAIYFDRFGLCTMVNSETYVDDDIGIRKDPSGINELIFGIAKSLDLERRSTWFQVVAQNQSFSSQMTVEFSDLSNVSVETDNSSTRANGNDTNSQSPESSSNETASSEKLSGVEISKTEPNHNSLSHTDDSKNTHQHLDYAALTQDLFT